MEIEKHSPRWLLNEIRNAESDAHALFKIIEFEKALNEQCNIANVVGQSEQLVCDIEKGTRCKDSFPSYKNGKCHNCGGQAN